MSRPSLADRSLPGGLVLAPELVASDPVCLSGRRLHKASAVLDRLARSRLSAPRASLFAEVLANLLDDVRLLSLRELGVDGERERLPRRGLSRGEVSALIAELTEALLQVK